MIMRRIHTHGYISMLVLVFAGVFFIIVSALAGFIFAQNKLQLVKENREKALQIAEAGLDYYKWRLSHYPNDLQDGTGIAGPYEHQYADPEGGEVGTFSLDISGNEQCGVTRSIDILSTGSTSADPNITRTVFGKYARPSVAEYSFILNSNVWSGSASAVLGRMHSNGGIRMDGNNQSLVESGVSTWTCTSSQGCDPSAVKSGIYGTGTNPQLWQYPVPQIDFSGISTDLSDMKTKAESSGLYLAPSTGFGYHLVFKNNGTIDAYRVDSASSVLGYSSQVGAYVQDYHTITSETFLQNYSLPSDCKLVFAEDDVWLDGVVNGKITVASADLINANATTDIILNNSIDYSTLLGTDGLTAVAEDEILIPLYVPTNMLLRGIFLAKSGMFGRRYYDVSTDSTYYLRDSLLVYGTIVTNYGAIATWCGSANPCSGFRTRSYSYDRTQAVNPPPLTPYVSSDYRFVEWREE